MKPRVFVSTFRWSNHSPHSGYDRLGNFLTGVKYLKCFNGKVRFPFLKDKVNRWMFLPFYNRFANTRQYLVEGFLTEWLVFFKALFFPNSIFHFVYGENEYSFSYRFKNLINIKLIATFHHPSYVLEELFYDPEKLRHLDKIILMSHSQKDFFLKYVPKENLEFIPHGIDTNFYKPNSDKKKVENGFQCIVVGTYLRDFGTLKKVVDDLEKVQPEIRFTIITSPQNQELFLSNKNVDIRRDLSEQQLLEAYQSSDLAIHPLYDSTANNSLLESMACGLPAVVTDIGGSRDYTDESCSLFVAKGNSTDLKNKILHLFNDPFMLEEMSKQSRSKALAFDWKVIAGQVKELYDSLSPRKY